MNNLGCHLYPWNDVLEKENLLGQETLFLLDDLKDLGFNAIETGLRFIPENREREVKERLAEKQLSLAAAHIGFPLFENSFQLPVDNLYKEIERLSHAGGERLIVSSEFQTNIDDKAIDRAVGHLNKLGEMCDVHGIEFVYHNHDHEFVNNARVEERLLNETNADTVGFALDVGWAYIAGVNPVTFFNNYFERIHHIHIRDVKEEDFVEAGRGEIDYDRFLRIAEEKHYTGWLMIESESSDKPLDDVNVSLKHLHALLNNQKGERP